jgi:hypothetical protein
VSQATKRQLSSVLAALSIIPLVLIFQNCGGGKSGSASPVTASAVTCDVGTSLDASGACKLDAAMSIVNPANSYWTCSGGTLAGVGGAAQFVLVATSNSGGTGSFLSPTSTNLTSFTWQELTSSSISVKPDTQGATITSLTDIVPSTPLSPASFSMSGGAFATSVNCTLSTGSINKRPSGPVTSVTPGPYGTGSGGGYGGCSTGCASTVVAGTVINSGIGNWTFNGQPAAQLNLSF